MPGLTTGETASAENRMERRDALRIWLRLLACSNTIEREIQTRLRDRFGVSIARFDFLAQLERAEDGELTMTELSQHLMVSGGNITGLTDRLSKEGLVKRRAHPADRRVQRISLTSEGKSLFAEMAGEHAYWIAELLSELDGVDKKALLDALDAIKNSAEKAVRFRNDRDGGAEQ
ncbi:MAG: MarR family transcriptional regulator [Fimbriimonadaceae bacterium]|nr:MarR family transcriptional regulator [Alphaproteobacteria bacterium]